MTRLARETVLITGASSGIGLELARQFAADKSDLVLVARNCAALEQLAAGLRERHQVYVRILAADLADPLSPGRIHDELGRAGVVVDVLVNNAGFGLHGEFADLPLGRQMEIIKVNIMALVELTGLFLPPMVQRRRGGILNVGSVAGFVPGPGMTVYFSSKAFVRSFSDGLVEELRGTGVSVTNLCPGPTETNFSHVARSHRSRNTQSTPKMSAELVARLGYQGFRRGKPVIITGFQNQLLAFLATRVFPRSWVRRLVGHYNRLD